MSILDYKKLKYLSKMGEEYDFINPNEAPYMFLLNVGPEIVLEESDK
mgnify:CR=1 FL=1